MKPTLIFSLAALLWAAHPAPAQMQDPGPMGIEASGNPTPDASVLSQMRLPAQPRSLSGTSGTAVQKSASRMMKFHKLWLQMEATAKRLQDANASHRLSDEKAAALQAELDALKAKYKLRIEDDGARLSSAKRQNFSTDLKAFSLKLDKEIQ